MSNAIALLCLDSGLDEITDETEAKWIADAAADEEARLAALADDYDATH